MNIKKTWDNYIKDPEAFTRGWLLGLVIGTCMVGFIGIVVLSFL